MKPFARMTCQAVALRRLILVSFLALAGNGCVYTSSGGAPDFDRCGGRENVFLAPTWDDSDKAFRLGKAKGLPAGTVSLSGEAVEVVRPGDALYSAEKPVRRHRKVTAIPFALWQNRGASEMAVWLHERV